MTKNKKYAVFYWIAVFCIFLSWVVFYEKCFSGKKRKDDVGVISVRGYLDSTTINIDTSSFYATDSFDNTRSITINGLAQDSAIFTLGTITKGELPNLSSDTQSTKVYIIDETGNGTIGDSYVGHGQIQPITGGEGYTLPLTQYALSIKDGRSFQGFIYCDGIHKTIFMGGKDEILRIYDSLQKINSK